MRRLALACVAGLLVWGCAGLWPPAAQNTYAVQDTRLFMSGEINRTTPRSLERMIRDHPRVRTIVMLDMPGSVDEEAVHEAGFFIRNAGLNTHLVPESEVYSGAVDLFLAGTRRSMTCCGVIGVHDWADDWGEGRDFAPDAPEHAANVAYYRAMLGSDAMYWFTLQAAPSDEIHVMTGQELARFGVFTTAVQP